MPLQDQFWGARFGQLTDRFGIDWMISIALTPVSAN
jgi:PhnB protein